MTKEEIAHILLIKIKEKYELTTDEEPPIDEHTAPFQDLEYFDSLIASEVGIELVDELESDFESIKKSFDKADMEGHTIEQMADIIHKTEET